MSLTAEAAIADCMEATPENFSEPELVSAKYIALKIGISRAVLHRLVRDRRIHKYKFGISRQSSALYKTSEIRSYVKTLGASRKPACNGRITESSRYTVSDK